MSGDAATKVFIAYTREHETIAAQISKDLAMVSNVFFDVTSLQVGENWQERVDAEIRGSDIFVLFWCRHAMTSRSVLQELDLAVKYGKTIKPIILDGSPLPDVILNIHYNLRYKGRCLPSIFDPTVRYAFFAILILLATIMHVFTAGSRKASDISEGDFFGALFLIFISISYVIYFIRNIKIFYRLSKCKIEEFLFDDATPKSIVISMSFEINPTSPHMRGPGSSPGQHSVGSRKQQQHTRGPGSGQGQHGENAHDQSH